MNKAEIMTKRHDKKCPQAPRLRFPEFRDEWHSQALGAIASIIKEKVGNKKCTLMSIMTGVGLIPQIDKFGKEIAGDQYKNYIIIRNNDFAYNKSATKGYPQGFIALYTGSEIAAVPNSIFTCFKIQPESIVPAYLNYLFLGNFHGKWLQRYITVGARAHGSLSIDDDDLLSLPIPYPKGVSSLGEQQKIADCLSSLDERIAAETSKLDRLKDHKKGLLKQLFPAEGETLPRLRFPDFRDAGEWGQAPLGELLLSQPDYGLNAPAVPYTSSLPTYIRITDISEGGQFIAEKKVSVDVVAVPENCLHPGDIVLARTGASVGKAYKYNENDGILVFAGFLIRVKPNWKKINSNFLFNFLFTKRYWDWVVLTSPRSGQPGINSSEYATLPVPTPPSDGDMQCEQQRIADCLSSLDELIAAQTQKIDLLNEHKKGLMQQLFPRIDEVLA